MPGLPQNRAPWLGSDFREVNGVVEDTRTSGYWTTVFGEVREGELLGVVVRGYQFGTFAKGEGKFVIRHAPSGLEQSQKILIRVKDTNEKTKDKIVGELQVLDFGRQTETPAGKGGSAKEWRAANKIQALDAMREMLRQSRAKAGLAPQSQQVLGPDGLPLPQQDVPRQAEDQRSQAMKDSVLKTQIENAEKGLPSSQYSLGMRYFKGDGVSEDEQLAKRWLAKSAAQGNTDAKTTLVILSNGGDVEDKTLRWQIENAEKGLPSYQYSLGMRYLNGEGLTQNEKLARELLTKAAEQGNADAKDALAKMPAENKAAKTRE